ncbi:sorbitol dehydrogenase-like [Macrosteles quadrilineatus]|uniref:sorbitol dehydrogenase-like n=1 Tax=Macrosteles quadrilineatus TaxID=74068 RepID=UPI0023E2A7DE|nr:sorbitol dehydrogenase-like [Macrosteles quadrilineatus]
MASDNLTAVLYDVNDIRLEQRPVPEPADDEVLLEMSCVGICGSDIHYWVHGRCADFILKAPMVMGHEASGTVAKIGKKVKHLKPGDRVAVEPGVPCRYCAHCKQGRYNLCADIIFCATPPCHGNLARYYTHAADFCFKIPDQVTLEEAALLEPLSVGVHACRRAGVTLGSNVLITGAGPIGLVTLLTAKSFGAGKVVITDVIDHRLGVAKQLGADYTVRIDPKASEKQTAAEIIDLLGDRPDITIDCTGFEGTIRLAIEATASGGVVTIVGMGSNEVTVPLCAAAAREIDIRGVFRYANDYPTALAMVTSGKVDVKKIITHHFTIEDTVKAFETAKSGVGNPIKIMIHCDNSGNAKK